MPMARGEAIGAFALTEPGGGSDARAIRTTAQARRRRVGDRRLEGVHHQLGDAADVGDHRRRAGRGGGRRRRLDDRRARSGRPGSRSARATARWLARERHPRGLVRRCRVPADHLLGERGRGYAQFLETLDEGGSRSRRCRWGSRGMPGGERAYAAEREAFGHPIGAFEGMRSSSPTCRWGSRRRGSRTTRGVAPRPTAARSRRSGDREALRERGRRLVRPGGRPDPRRLRVRRGVTRGARLPGREGARDRGGHQRDPASDPRPGLGLPGTERAPSGKAASLPSRGGRETVAPGVRRGARLTRGRRSIGRAPQWPKTTEAAPALSPRPRRRRRAAWSRRSGVAAPSRPPSRSSMLPRPSSSGSRGDRAISRSSTGSRRRLQSSPRGGRGQGPLGADHRRARTSRGSRSPRRRRSTRACKSQLDERARQAYINGPGRPRVPPRCHVTRGPLRPDGVRERPHPEGCRSREPGGEPAERARRAEGRSAGAPVEGGEGFRKVEAESAALDAKFDEQQAVMDDLDSKKARAEELVKDLTERYQQELEALTGLQFHRTVSAGLPGGPAEGRLRRLRRPAVRGGYHPHAGNDIIAPKGSAIRATFPGSAQASSNTLGGYSVNVYGRPGYTYNAHLCNRVSRDRSRPDSRSATSARPGTQHAARSLRVAPERDPDRVAEEPVRLRGHRVRRVNPLPLLAQVC